MVIDKDAHDTNHVVLFVDDEVEILNSIRDKLVSKMISKEFLNLILQKFSKYLRKMRGWSDIHLAMLWSGHSRMYSFSRGFSIKLEKKESEWQKLRIVRTDNIDELEYNLMKGGYVIDTNQQSDASSVIQN